MVKSSLSSCLSTWLIGGIRRSLPKALNSLIASSSHPEEHVFEAQLLPETKDFLVPEEDITACFEVVLLLDAGAGDRLSDRQPVPLLQEGDIVDDEDAGLTDRSQILDRSLWADQPIASAVKGPGAAEGAIPRTAARKLDGGAGIERAEKIFPAMAQQRRAGIKSFSSGRSRAAGPLPRRSRHPPP